jgi:translation elongation factor EF-1alpha
MADEIEGAKEVGRVDHFYSGISVAVVDLSDKLKVGDKIRFKGATTDFEQTVESMQIEHKNMDEAKKGDSIGMKVADRVREGDVLYKV